MSCTDSLNETSHLKEGKSRRYNAAETGKDAGYKNPGFLNDDQKTDDTSTTQSEVEDKKGSLESSTKSTFGLQRQLGVSGATSLIFGCIVGWWYHYKFLAFWGKHDFSYVPTIILHKSYRIYQDQARLNFPENKTRLSCIIVRSGSHAFWAIYAIYATSISSRCSTITKPVYLISA